MPIIPPAPESILDCTLMIALQRKSSSGTGIYDKAANFIKTASPLVDLTIGGPFRNYTLHNRDHSKKLIHLAGCLLSPPIVESMSELDSLAFIYAAFIHDMGMSLTSIERDRIIESSAFDDEIQSWPALAEAYAGTLRRLADSQSDRDREVNASELYELQEGALASYLRPRHGTPERYRDLIARINAASDRQDLFSHRGVSFENLLIEICASHVQDAGILTETISAYADRFPRKEPVGGLYLNAQFCAALLRITDILDFDRERTPRILFESLGIAARSIPGAKVTLLEWQKHLSVHTIEMNGQEFVISAQVHHPVIERSIREFSAIIEREVRDTLAILRRNPAEITEAYLPDLPVTVRPHINSVGYVYRDMALSLNQPRILDLLMGERLYNHPAAALRELLQNSMDACSVRREREGDHYVPRIEVTDEVDANGKYWLIVRDNGTGMDEHILSEYFLTLGNSYYKSAEFKRQLPSYRPISRFGIGIAAVFVIADVLELRTKCVESPRGDTQGRCVRIEGILSLAFVTESQSITAGTEIRLMIKPEFARNQVLFANACLQYLRKSIIRPRVAVHTNLAGYEHPITGEAGIRPKPDASAALSEKELELVLIDIGRWSNRFQGAVGIFFHVLQDGRLSHLTNGEFVRTSRTFKAEDYLIGFPGNKLSVNGFTMSVKGLSKIFGRGRERLAVIYHLDLIGDEEIVFDISRQKVVGAGRLAVLNALEAAVYSGLEGLGILNRLEADTRRIFTAPTQDRHHPVGGDGFGLPFAGVDNESVLESVLALMPAGPWPIGLHKEIAKRLAISNGLASRAISTLIATGRLRKT